MPRPAAQRSVGWVVGLAIAVVGIAAVLVLSQFATETTPLEELAAGDCIIEPEGLLVEEVDRVDCAEPHNYEVFAIYRESGGPYPGDEGLFTLAEVECGTYFESYVGVPFSESDVWYTYFTPTEEGWEQGNRDVTCMLYTLDGEFELATNGGSLQNIRK